MCAREIVRLKGDPGEGPSIIPRGLEPFQIPVALQYRCELCVARGFFGISCVNINGEIELIIEQKSLHNG